MAPELCIACRLRRLATRERRRVPTLIDPVPGAVRAWHLADEQHAILLVQEDLYPPPLSRPSSRRRQIDDLMTVNGN